MSVLAVRGRHFGMDRRVLHGVNVYGAIAVLTITFEGVYGGCSQTFRQNFLFLA